MADHWKSNQARLIAQVNLALGVRLPPVAAQAERKQIVWELVGDLCATLGQAQRNRLLDVVEVGMVGHKCPCFCQRCDVGDILQILLAALQLNGEVQWRRRSSCRRLSCGLPTRSDLREAWQSALSL